MLFGDAPLVSVVTIEFSRFNTRLMALLVEPI